MESKTKALAIAGAASDKKALDIVLINMKKMPSVCNYFVIVSGTSTTHVNAIADNIEKCLREKGQRLWHSEGANEALWVLLDFADVVVHIFLKETRRFYNLERLWRRAPQERFKEGKAKLRARRPARPKAKTRVKTRRRKKSPKRAS